MKTRVVNKGRIIYKIPNGADKGIAFLHYLKHCKIH